MIMIRLARLVVMAALAVPAVVAAQPACTAMQLPIPPSTREIVLNGLVGDDIKEVGRMPRSAFPGGVIDVENCGTSRYYRYVADGKRYLVAQAALTPAGKCQCTAAGTIIAGVPGAAACDRC